MFITPQYFRHSDPGWTLNNRYQQPYMTVIQVHWLATFLQVQRWLLPSKQCLYFTFLFLKHYFFFLMNGQFSLLQCRTWVFTEFLTSTQLNYFIYLTPFSKLIHNYEIINRDQIFLSDSDPRGRCFHCTAWSDHYPLTTHYQPQNFIQHHEQLHDVFRKMRKKMHTDMSLQKLRRKMHKQEYLQIY